METSITFHYYNNYNQNLKPLNTTELQNRNKYTYQSHIQPDKVLTPYLVSSNENLTKEISYTISSFIHVPFPQQIIGNNTTNGAGGEYSKTIKIGANTLTVSYTTTGKILPSGIYPRRLFSYLCSQIVITKSKTPIIELPRTKSQFLKEILKINYVCSKKENLIIEAQLKAFCECLVSIQYSNSNDSARKPQNSIKFIEGDASWLYDNTQKWQRQISLSEEMLELIKQSSVPISAKANAEFTNSRKLDLFNYFTYQNYNLYIKKLDCSFELEDLHNQFGTGLSTISSFRRVLNKILSDFKSMSCLDVVAKNKHYYKLLSNEESLLQQHKRRKTHEIKHEKLTIKDDHKDKLEKDYPRLDIESACSYVAKRYEHGKVRHPYAYLRDVLKNPSWYYKEKQNVINIIHRKQLDEYERLPESDRKQAKNMLLLLIKNAPHWGLPSELQPVLEQFKNPNKNIINIPSFKHICYLFWAFNFNKCIDVCDGSNEVNVINLFKHLR